MATTTVCTDERTATLASSLEAVGRLIAWSTGPLDRHVVHAVTNLLVRAAGPHCDRLAVTSVPHDTPQIIYERTLGRLATATIGRTITLSASACDTLELLVRELAPTSSLDDHLLDPDSHSSSASGTLPTRHLSERRSETEQQRG